MLRCTRCRFANEDAAQFCGNCGNRLTADWATRVAPTAEEARRAPGPASARQPEAVAAEDKNAAALRLVAEGRLSEALEALNEAIRLAPNHAPSYLNRADVLGRLGMISQAEADRRMAGQLAPASVPPVQSVAGTVACPSCGQSAPADAGFCSRCGGVVSAVVYAGFWIRLVASIIDGLILLIPNIVVAAAVTDPVARFLIQLVIGLAYTVGFWTARGATPGKMAMGIQITTADGEPIGFGTALLRYIGYLVSTITLLIGYLMIAFTRQKRGLHDYIAGTVVIKTR